MRHALLLIALAGLLSACQPNESASQSTAKTPEAAKAKLSETERLNRWFAKKYEEKLQMSPMEMTFLGRKDKYDQIDNMSLAEEQRVLAWQGETVKEMKASFDYDQLDLEAKTSYDIWVYQYEQALAGQEFVHNRYVFNQMQGMQSFMAQFLISFHKVENEQDMLAYNKRIGGVSTALHDLLTQAQVNTDHSVRPPRYAYEAVIKESTSQITGNPFTESDDDSPVWADAKNKILALMADKSINEERGNELLQETKQALLTKFKPAYEELIDWFSKDMANSDTDAQGASTLPNGKAYYNYQLQKSTTTDLTAEQIHQLGLEEVDRLTKEMEAIMDKVGFDGDLHAFFEFIRTDDQFFYPDTDEGRQAYIDDAQAYLDFIKQKLPEYFGILPKADLVVKRVEAFREQPGAAQHYFPGTPDGSRPGVYYAHLSDMRAMPKNEMEAVAYHEGLPGHHMQISIAQELTSVPEFRTQAGFTAYVEGWALYAELLAKQMGAYQNDYSDFGRLITEMWRAVRLVVDTGIHAKGWSEEQAISYFKEKTPIAAEAIKSEVRRYTVWPGQATSYKIGMLKILELRHLAEQELGDKFDIRTFHDAVLGGGALPLEILERRIKNWIKEVKTAV
ncbi:DUF885 domain-containing protein [Neptunicella sp. SCSIO 80796]|uniref:DUF885 domain-containing protein n=1 Tax=Neptunicella plasticusilytica TaxID=3117012 RepID=UPI003A4D38DE